MGRGGGAVRGRRRVRLGALVLREAPLAEVDPGRVRAAMLGAIRAEGLGALPWTKAARQLQQRLAFYMPWTPTGRMPATAPAGAAGGVAAPPSWRACAGATSYSGWTWSAILLAMLPWEQRAALERLAPTHLAVPSGSRIPVDYDDPAAPVLAVRLQEMFGLDETPRIGGGRVPLTLHLLSPAHRPVQVTRDLASFWRATYFDVKKDLRVATRSTTGPTTHCKPRPPAARDRGERQGEGVKG